MLGREIGIGQIGQRIKNLEVPHEVDPHLDQLKK